MSISQKYWIAPSQSTCYVQTLADAKLVTTLSLADCKEGQQTNGTDGCEDCPEDTYQPTGVTNMCYSCGAGYGTVKGNAVRAGDKDVICKGW